MLKTIFMRKREAKAQLEYVEKIDGELYCELLSKCPTLNSMSDDEVSYYIWEHPYRRIIAVPGYDLTKYGESSATYKVWKKHFGKEVADKLIIRYLNAYHSLLLLQHDDERAWEVSEILDSLWNGREP